MDATLETFEQVRTTVVDLAVKFGPKVLAALLILPWLFCRPLGVTWLGRALGHSIWSRRFARYRADRWCRDLGAVPDHGPANLGVELLPLIAGLGVAGAGIALAMQGVLGNLLAGLTIILTKPFGVGEYIEIVSEEGAVENVSLFQTVLAHPDRSRVVIPNRKIVGEILHNFGKIRQLTVVVGVAYDTDLNRAMALVQQTLRANARILRDIEPMIVVSSLADSSVNIAVKPWVAIKDFAVAASEINQAILEAFRDAGIVIPFPQREVRMVAVA